MKKEFRFNFGVCDVTGGDAQELFGQILKCVKSLGGRIVGVELSWRVDISPGLGHYYFRAEKEMKKDNEE